MLNPRITNLLTFILAAAVMTGCAEEPPKSDLTILEQLQSPLLLERFASCEDLETYMKDLAIAQIERQYDTTYNDDRDWGMDIPMGVSMDIAESGGEPAPMQAAGGEGGESFEESGTTSTNASPTAPSDPTKSADIDADYTGTNNQEKSVDEADIVKTDGAYVYILRDHSLLIADAWPPESADVVSTTTIEGYPLQMFVQEDTLAIFSEIDIWLAQEQGLLPADMKGWSATKITMLDITNRNDPRIVREVYAEGRYNSARLVGQTARVVLHTEAPQFDMPYYYDDLDVSEPGVAVFSPTPSIDREDEPEFFDEEGETDEEGTDIDEAGKADFGFDIFDFGTEPETDPTLEDMKAAAIAIVLATTLEDLVPRVWETGTSTASSTTTESLLADCSSHYKPSIEAGLSVLTIITLDMANPAEARTSAAILGEAGHVYASADALYIASDLYSGWLSQLPEATDEYLWTAIHKFDIATSGDEAIYAGSGKVAGRILNQFSLSEHDGYLRVASTRETWTQPQTSHVTVLEDQGEELIEIGHTEALAPGEDIYSARFVGEKGYVVTFEQMDPLFTIDLSDPTDPRMVGELKIPGFSTYIHPMDDGHLLTIGQHTWDNGDWVSVGGIQLTIFDVTDFANPKQAHKIVLDENAWSEAVYEHKAFTYHAADGLLALPISSWGGFGGIEPIQEGEWEEGEWNEEEWVEPEQTVGLSVFTVDTANGIAEHGFIDHADFLDTEGYGWEEVRRSLIMGDHIYSIGRMGMKVATAADLDTVATVVFPEEPTPDYYGGTKGAPSVIDAPTAVETEPPTESDPID